MLLTVLFVALLALLLERRSRKSLEDVREGCSPSETLVDPDETFYLRYSLRNTGPRHVLFLRLRQDLPDAFCPGESAIVRAAIAGKQMALTTWLRPRQEAHFALPVSVSRRGFYRLPSLEVSGGDFLGLREEVRRSSGFRAVTVAPRGLPQRDLGEVLGGFLGEISVRRFIHEDPVLTVGYREYTGREPMKAISWTQSARGMGLMVKNYDHTAQPAVSVLLNVDADTEAEELEVCFSLARTVCGALEERGVAYSFSTNALDAETLFYTVSDVEEGLGPLHFSALLERLGRACCRASYPGERLLEYAAAAGSGRGRILITQGGELDGSAALARLRELGSVVILRAREAA